MLGPDAKTLGTLTEPREFNLMFKTYVGALSGEEGAAFLRPETAQGIFVNFKNVLDSSRVRLPFGIGQMGKSFRNEITPRNFTFRSREFEQMEIEFFCHPKTSPEWYRYWRDRRYRWYLELGLAGERLRLRDHDQDELSHYSCGTADIEYAFPFLPPGEFGELEGIAHRGDFDLRSHMEGKLVRKGGELVVEEDADGKPRHRGSGKDLSYRDDLTGERYVPHVIEPSAGADRATLAFLCQAYTEDKAPDENGKPTERVVMKFHPAAGADQGGRVSAGEEGRHARGGRADLSRAEAPIQRVLRRKRGGRPPLSPPGRGRHAVLHHRRRPNAAGPDRDDPRPRQLEAVAHQSRRLRGRSWPVAVGLIRLGFPMIPTLAQVSSLNSPFEKDIEDYAAGACRSVELWLGKLEGYLEKHSDRRRPPAARRARNAGSGGQFSRRICSPARESFASSTGPVSPAGWRSAATGRARRWSWRAISPASSPRTTSSGRGIRSARRPSGRPTPACGWRWSFKARRHWPTTCKPPPHWSPRPGTRLSACASTCFTITSAPASSKTWAT